MIPMHLREYCIAKTVLPQVRLLALVQFYYTVCKNYSILFFFLLDVLRC